MSEPFTNTASDATKATLDGLHPATTLGTMSVLPQGSAAVELRNPFLGLNFMVTVIGLYPVRH